MSLMDSHAIARQRDVDHTQVFGVRPEQRRQIGLLQIGPLVVHHNHIRRSVQSQRLDILPGSGGRDHLGIAA